MTTRTAESRMRGLQAPSLRGSLALRIVLSHLVAAAGTVVLLSIALLDSRLPLSALVALSTVGLAVAGALGLILAHHIVAPIAELICLVEARTERAAEHDGAAFPAWPKRRDEIGRLSSALGRLAEQQAGCAAANEEFAADIAHEIRNPLASLRSAAEAIRRADDEQRSRLLDIVAQDVARLDRLVGEISTASRLDAELVREEAATFDLVATVRGLARHLAREANEKGVEIIADLPEGQICLDGLEARLAQVVVNVVANAVSVCEDGDAIRIWMRRREGQVVLAVEDTGPGIPEGSGERIFRRFYSYRPAARPGDHSGLGLAISRQIVEAHGGMIWAENIRPTESDLLSEPLGARFVVVLPL